MEKIKSIKDIKDIQRGMLENICVTNADHAYIGNNLQLCRVLSKYKMYIDGRDAGIAPHLIMEGFWESWITKFIARVVEPGFFCLDIGANFGYYSLMLAELAGDNGKAMAIEPNPHLCKLLRMNSAMNNWHFDVVQGAASDKAGEATLTVFENFFGGATIMDVKDSGPGVEHYNVRTFTIDSLMQEKQWPKLDFLKMDCEGFEPFVFAGMEQTLQKNPALKMVVEYSAYMYKDAESFTNMLFDRFNVFHINASSEPEKLSSKDISGLLAKKAPYDMYLEGKGTKSFFSFLKG